MLMKRRTPPSWIELLRVMLWPRRSWLRSGQYVTKRILRLTASPHAVAAGVAAGAFTSFTPFMGFHFLVAGIVAWLFRGNFIASALGTFVGNPITFPFIWAATYNTGRFITGATGGTGETPALGEAMSGVIAASFNLDPSAALAALGQIWTPVVYPMFVGGLVLGPFLAVPVYFATKRAALLFREARRNKLMAKAAALRDRAKALAESKKLPQTGQRV